MTQGQLAKCWLQSKAYKVNKIQCLFLFTPFRYRLSDITENVACSRSSAAVSRKYSAAT
jgi:hypothetical protein